MKTNLNRQITTSEEAEAFLTELFNNKEHYHPEDDAFDVDFPDAEVEPTEDERAQLNVLMNQVYIKAEFDPCEVIYDLVNAGVQMTSDCPPCQNFAKND